MTTSTRLRAAPPSTGSSGMGGIVAGRAGTRHQCGPRRWTQKRLPEWQALGTEQRRELGRTRGLARPGDEGGEAALLSVCFASVNRALLGSAVEGGVGSRQGGRGSGGIAGGGGLAQMAHGAAGEGAGGAVAVAALQGLVPALDGGLIVCHRKVCSRVFRKSRRA